MTRGCLYYTDNTLNRGLAKLCREYITHANLPITSVSLKPLDFGNNIVLPLERSYETLATQILTGLEAMTEDIVYFTEHDDLYHPNHFEFIPPEKNKFYYNGNYWFLREDGFAVHYNVSPLSGLVAYREPLINHFRERLELIKKDGYSFKMGFEPMTHHRIPWKYWYDFEIFMPEFPNVDICHGKNLTWKRFDQKDFRRKPKFWEESDIYHILGWSDLPDILNFKKPKSEKVDTPKSDETLTIVIPARNEEFIGLTVEDILKNIEGNTDIIVALDGYTVPIPPIPQDKRVTILGYHESIGQRAATNNAVRLSKSKYIAKCDAHCSFDKGFDVKLMRRMKPEYTMVPIMRNLWVFDWKCKNGHTRYQGPSGPCTECGEPTFKDMKWIGKESPQSTAYCFDSEPHFQYENSRKKTKEYLDGIVVGYKLFIDPSFTTTDSLEGVVPFSVSGSQPASLTSIISLLTDFARSHHFTSSSNLLRLGQDMPMNTVGLPSIDGSGSVGVNEVKIIGDKPQVEGVTTSPVLTDVVNNGDVLPSSSGNLSNEPSVDKPVCEFLIPEVGTFSITTSINPTSPIPTTRKVINSDLIKELNNKLGGEFVYNEKTNRFHNGSVALETINDKDLTETMSLQGSFWMLTRDKYWELNICDEEFGSWGSQGIQVAVSTWLSGGRVVCNHDTWYAHCFRTQGSDFGFPYELSGRQTERAKKLARNKLHENKWPKQIHPSSWLIEKFWPYGKHKDGTPFWSEKDLTELKKAETPSQ